MNDGFKLAATLYGITILAAVGSQMVGAITDWVDNKIEIESWKAGFNAGVEAQKLINEIKND